MKIGDLVNIKQFRTTVTPMTERFGGCFGFITEVKSDYERYEMVYYMVYLFDRDREYLFKDFEVERIKEQK